MSSQRKFTFAISSPDEFLVHKWLTDRQTDKRQALHSLLRGGDDDDDDVQHALWIRITYNVSVGQLCHLNV